MAFNLNEIYFSEKFTIWRYLTSKSSKFGCFRTVGRCSLCILVINVIAVSLFLLQIWFACNPAFYFNVGEKLRRHITFSCTCFWYCRKHPINDNKIYFLPFVSNSTFMTGSQHSGTQALNSDLVKLEWIPLLSNVN